MPNENNIKRNLRRIRNNSYPIISSKEFVLEDCPEILSQSDHVFMYVIYKMIPLPVVYALLPKKTQTVYVELLMALKDTCSPVKSFSIDFELAMIKANEEVFEDSVFIHLCYYLFSQSVWSKVQNLDLATKYTKKQRIPLFSTDDQCIGLFTT
ncbi:hypothetical protein QTP88_028707 [Uroleucon formosanum]